MSVLCFLYSQTDIQSLELGSHVLLRRSSFKMREGSKMFCSFSLLLKWYPRNPMFFSSGRGSFKDPISRGYLFYLLGLLCCLKYALGISNLLIFCLLIVQERILLLYLSPQNNQKTYSKITMFCFSGFCHFVPNKRLKDGGSSLLPLWYMCITSSTISGALNSSKDLDYYYMASCFSSINTCKASIWRAL